MCSRFRFIRTPAYPDSGIYIRTEYVVEFFPYRSNAHCICRGQICILHCKKRKKKQVNPGSKSMFIKTYIYHLLVLYLHPSEYDESKYNYGDRKPVHTWIKLICEFMMCSIPIDVINHLCCCVFHTTILVLNVMSIKIFAFLS